MKFLKINIVLLAVFALVTLSGCDTRHNAKLYKLKNYHIAMRDDRGKWWEYTLNNADINFDIPWVTGNAAPKLPTGGSWRVATQQEEDEVVETNELVSEDTIVDETDAGAPEGDVGGGDAGDDGGDSGGDGGE